MYNPQQVFLYMKEEIEQAAKLTEETLLQEAADLEQQACAKIRKEVKNEVENQLKKEMAQLSTNASKNKSLKQAKRKQQLIEKREQYVTEIFKEAREKLVAFTKQKEYKQHLIRGVKQVSEKYQIHNANIYVREEDLQYKEDILKAYGSEVEITSCNTIIIGGFIIENKAVGIVLDESLDNALENQKEWFYHTSGLTIY